MGIWDNQLPKWMEILKQQANPKKSTNFTYNPNWNVIILLPANFCEKNPL